MSENLNPIISHIKKLFVKNEITYSQSRHIIYKVRKDLGLAPPKQKKGDVEVLTIDQLDEFLQCAGQKNLQEKLMIETMYMTGCRLAEFCNLEVRDLVKDNELYQIIIRSGKGDKRRVVPVVNEFAEKLIYFLAGRETGPLFFNQRNKAYSHRAVQALVSRIAERTIIDSINIHPHTFRHTRLTHLAEKNMSVEQLKEFAGHEHIKDTMRYIRNAKFKLKEKLIEVEGGRKDII